MIPTERASERESERESVCERERDRAGQKLLEITRMMNHVVT